MCRPTWGTPIPVTPPKATQTLVAGHKQAAGLMSGGQPPHCTGKEPQCQRDSQRGMSLK